MKKKLADEIGKAYGKLHKKSLRARLSKLRFDGVITLDEYKELLSLLEKRDKVRIINWLSTFNKDFWDFQKAINETISLERKGYFKRRAIAWELWQVIKGTPLNIIDYENYKVINDWTCDIDEPGDVSKMERFIK